MNPNAHAQTGKFTPKHARQEKRSISAPPTSGAATSAIDWIPLTMPSQRGRFCRGKRRERLLIAPLEIPAEARPERARPNMKMGEVGARVHVREARVKSVVEARKRGRRGNCV